MFLSGVKGLGKVDIIIRNVVCRVKERGFYFVLKRVIVGVGGEE